MLDQELNELVKQLVFGGGEGAIEPGDNVYLERASFRVARTPEPANETGQRRREQADRPPTVFVDLDLPRLAPPVGRASDLAR